MPDHSYFSNHIWQIADLLRGPYRPPRYERVMLPLTVLITAAVTGLLSAPELTEPVPSSEEEMACSSTT